MMKIALLLLLFLLSFYLPDGVGGQTTNSTRTSPKIRKILCVGDSITFGTGSSDPSHSYPSLLQEKLDSRVAAHSARGGHSGNTMGKWGGSDGQMTASRLKRIDNFTVVNLGVKGTTAFKQSHAPYWKTSQYSTALTSSDVAAVVLQLGSNDALYFQHWEEGRFTADYLDLIHSLQGVDGHPKVFICIPTPLLPRFASTKVNSTVINFIYPQLLPAIATQAQVEVIDLFRPFGGNVSENIWHATRAETVGFFVNDGLHPNDRGFEVIAETVAEHIWKYFAKV